VAPPGTNKPTRASEFPSHGKATKYGSSESSESKSRPWWRPMTAWAGSATTSVIVAVVCAIAVYAVHSELSRPERADLSAPPVKVEGVEVSPLDNDLLSARVIHSARTVNVNHDGLVPAMGITALIHAEGNRNGLVRIVDIQVVKTCAAPLRGTIFFFPPQGETSTLGIGFDLDDPRTVAREIPSVGAVYGPERLGPSYFANHEYDLTLGEPITLAITAETARYFCKFRFELDLLVNGRPATEIIGDGGKPFLASAEYDVPHQGWLPAFSVYGALYVAGFTTNACAASDGLVAENPRTWHYPPSLALPASGCASAPADGGRS
jgi:hypothetical protein